MSKPAPTLKNPRILVVPLDWGLGHFTRCIPIIRELQNQNCEVWIGGNSDLRQILSREFYDLNFLPIPGYRVNYSGTKRFFIIKILMQVPKIVRILYKEHKWLKKIICDFSFDAVISDNRYGLYSKKIPSIFITHQLFIISGMNNWIDYILKHRNFKFIEKFQECWIPDLQGEPNLSGKLSHDGAPPKNIKYIGPISRFKKSAPQVPVYEIAIILSGPEPQRSIWEKQLLSQIQNTKEKVLLVRGLPNSNENISVASSNVEIINYLGSEDLNQKILQSKCIICRAGYSSIMDLVALQKKAILVPTPGQTEQEYLAKYLHENGIFYSVDQEEFDLTNQIELAKNFQFKFPDLEESLDQYKIAVQELVSAILLIKSNK